MVDKRKVVWFGTTKIEFLQSKFPDIKHVKQNSKGRYFAFRGSKKAVKTNKLAIKHLIKPYPKRGEHKC